MRTSALLLLLTLTSCMEWVAVEMPAPQATTQKGDSGPGSPSEVWGRVRVHLDDGQRIEFQHVALIGDSLWGELAVARPDAGRTAFAVPVRRVTRVEMRQRTDPLKTAFEISDFLSAIAGTLPVPCGTCPKL
jgi:hypothetical protein